MGGWGFGGGGGRGVGVESHWSPTGAARSPLLVFPCFPRQDLNPSAGGRGHSPPPFSRPFDPPAFMFACCFQVCSSRRARALGSCGLLRPAPQVRGGRSHSIPPFPRPVRPSRFHVCMLFSGVQLAAGARMAPTAGRSIGESTPELPGGGARGCVGCTCRRALVGWSRRIAAACGMGDGWSACFLGAWAPGGAGGGVSFHSSHLPAHKALLGNTNFGAPQPMHTPCLPQRQTYVYGGGHRIEISHIQALGAHPQGVNPMHWGQNKP